MKYDDIITLWKGNIKTATSHSVSAKSAYQFTKFKCEIVKHFQDYQTKDGELIKTAGIDDAEAFDNRIKVLQGKERENSLNQAEKKEIKSMTDKLVRLQKMRDELYNEEVKIECSPMPYEDWHNLKNENRNLKIEGYEILDFIEQQNIELENYLKTNGL